MSKAARIPDVDRTATMLDLIRQKHGEVDGESQMSRAYVVLEEVAPGTGFSGAKRWADVLALGVWPSKGLTLDGYEIKASRADLKKELADPSKHRALARYCDTWTLVVWDESVLVDGIPEDWGILLTRDGEHGRELYRRRSASKREPEPWPRSFVCSLVRNAYDQAPCAAFVGRAVEAANERLRRSAEIDRRHAARESVRPLARILFGPHDWRWPREAADPEKVIAMAAERLTQLPLAQDGAA